MRKTRKLCAVMVDTIGRELVINRENKLDERGWPVHEGQPIQVSAGDKVIYTSVHRALICLLLSQQVLGKQVLSLELRVVVQHQHGAYAQHSIKTGSQLILLFHADHDHNQGTRMQCRGWCAAHQLSQICRHGAKGRYHLPGSLSSHRL